METTIIVGIICLIVGAVGGFYLASFIKMSKSEKADMIINCLVYLVAAAEHDLGSGTGELKLAKVYNEFVAEYPQLAETITFEQFKGFVDKALAKMQEILKNDDIKKVILNEEEKN